MNDSNFHCMTKLSGWLRYCYPVNHALSLTAETALYQQNRTRLQKLRGAVISRSIVVVLSGNHASRHINVNKFVALVLL